MLGIIGIYYVWVLKKRSGAIISILLMNMSFIPKSMKGIERPIIVEFLLNDQLLMNLKFIIMRN
jgi:hypothetical protein